MKDKKLLSAKKTEDNQTGNTVNILTATANIQTIQRFGEAARQSLVAYSGYDGKTDQFMASSLKKIYTHKINPDFIKQNIKQQAGYAAETISTARRNAESEINGNGIFASRSEDISGFGKNHNIVDIVETKNGEIIARSQQKFVTDTKALLRKIARGKGGGKTDFSRYLEVDYLDVPSEQVEEMKEFCQKEAKSLFKQAEHAKLKGDIDLANSLKKDAENYQSLENKIRDSKLTTDEAIYARLNPKTFTAKEIIKTSHQSGIEGAKTGALIGGSISILTNLIATSTGKKELKEAILDSAKETAIAAGVGYGTNFSGSTIKAFLQQSTNQGLKKLSNTSFPAMVVSTCLAAGRSIRKYAEGEINATEMTQEMSLTVSGMLSASSFAAIGQLAIPVPVLGAMIGSLIGYTLTNTFYQSFFDVLKNKNLSIERRRQIEQDCEIAKQSALEFERRVKDIFAQRVQELEHYSSKMFAALDNPNSSIEEFTTAMNDFANILGKKLSINSIAELDAIMLSDEPLIF